MYRMMISFPSIPSSHFPINLGSLIRLRCCIFFFFFLCKTFKIDKNTIEKYYNKNVKNAKQYFQFFYTLTTYWVRKLLFFSETPICQFSYSIQQILSDKLNITQKFQRKMCVVVLFPLFLTRPSLPKYNKIFYIVHITRNRMHKTFHKSLEYTFHALSCQICEVHVPLTTHAKRKMFANDL